MTHGDYFQSAKTKQAKHVDPNYIHLRVYIKYVFVPLCETCFGKIENQNGGLQELHFEIVATREGMCQDGQMRFSLDCLIC